MPALYEIYLAVLVALLLVAGYLALLLFLSWVGGWAVLAGAFRSGPFAPAKSHSFATANIASHEWPVAYARCLFVEFDERGIAMEIFPLFRFRHPPLLIPWSAVANCVRSRGVFYEWTTITLSGGMPTLEFYGAVGRDLHRFYEARSLRLSGQRASESAPAPIMVQETR